MPREAPDLFFHGSYVGVASRLAQDPNHPLRALREEGDRAVNLSENFPPFGVRPIPSGRWHYFPAFNQGVNAR